MTEKRSERKRKGMNRKVVTAQERNNRRKERNRKRGAGRERETEKKREKRREREGERERESEGERKRENRATEGQGRFQGWRSYATERERKKRDGQKAERGAMSRTERKRGIGNAHTHTHRARERERERERSGGRKRVWRIWRGRVETQRNRNTEREGTRKGLLMPLFRCLAMVENSVMERQYSCMVFSFLGSHAFPCHAWATTMAPKPRHCETYHNEKVIKQNILCFQNKTNIALTCLSGSNCSQLEAKNSLEFSGKHEPLGTPPPGQT